MAHLIFVAKRRPRAVYQLSKPALLGRSVDCDVFVPDVFTSREHCRFEQEEGEWVVKDVGSRNGIFIKGQRVNQRALHHGDRIEVGSFTIKFDEGDIDEELSTPTPFGDGTSVASLMDTLFAENLRPAEYLQRSQKKPAWVRAREEAELARQREIEAAKEEERLRAERLNFSDGAELDIEVQIAAESVDLLPEFVLVSRNDLERLRMGVGQTAMVGATVIAEGDQLGVGELDHLLPSAETAEMAQVGPVKGRNLWEVAASEARQATEKRRKPKAEVKAEETAPVKVEAPSRPSLLERFRDWREEKDFSIGGMIESMQAHMVRTAIAAILVVGLSVGAIVMMSRRSYKAPDFTKMTPQQKQALEVAASAN